MGLKSFILEQLKKGLDIEAIGLEIAGNEAYKNCSDAEVKEAFIAAKKAFSLSDSVKKEEVATAQAEQKKSEVKAEVEKALESIGVKGLLERANKDSGESVKR